MIGFCLLSLALTAPNQLEKPTLFKKKGTLSGSNLTPMPKPKDDSQLTTTGVYGLVRHPIYGGLILAALGYSLVLPTVAGFILAVVTFIFFNQKASREEKWLRERYSEYLPYSMQTRKLIPWVF